ncbi:MAG: PQQ-binding-like beta-propeller repeat protein [Acidobacteriota bacterium]|nr:PQQ-binding-like beta-propeller repeat protein [Acidobacteriota bacterium]
MPSIRWKMIVPACAIILAAVSCGRSGVAESEDFSFVTISDVHIPSYGFAIGQPLDEASLASMHNVRRLRQFVGECLALDPRPAFVMNCGDTGDVGWMPLLNIYRETMRPLVSAGIPVFTVAGNHDLDYAGIDRRDLAAVFDPLGPALIGRGGTRYSFDHGGCHFVVLNNRPVTGLIRLNPDDVEWLRKDLEGIGRKTRILLFLHADMPEEDTHHVVELLQSFEAPVIFQGHFHSDATDRWGGVPVVLTGALYGGSPEAGSFRVVTVSPRKITVRTRDFGTPAGTFGPETEVEFLPPGPKIRVLAPKNEAAVGRTLSVTAAAGPSARGRMEYSIPGFADWTPMKAVEEKWEALLPFAGAPGRHLLRLRFTGDDGAVAWAHAVFKSPGEDVREIWSRDLGAAVMGGPAIWRDRVFVPAIGRGVCALRLSDGKEIWSRETEGQVLGRVAVDGDTVYFGAGRTVFACEGRDGKILWRTPLDGAVIAGVTAHDGRLWIPAGERKLFCLDARRGGVLWECAAGLPVMMEPAVDGGSVFFGSMDGWVRALDGRTGGELWKTRISSPEDLYTTAPFWPPAAAGELVIISKIPAAAEENNLLALSASDGRVAWSRRVSGVPLRAVAIPEENLLFTLLTGKSRGLQCLSLRDGSLLWSRESGVGMNAGIASGGAVLLRDDDDLCCVDAATGAVRWTYRTSTGPQGTYYGPGAFAARDRLVVVGTMDGMVTALEW